MATVADQPSDERIPEVLAPHRLRRRAAVAVAVLVILVLILLLAPELSDVRHKLDEAAPGWLAVAVLLELLSCASYVLMFRPVFCTRMGWRQSVELGLSELAVGSIVPASGAGGLALGAWLLRRDGMPTERIARRSVAFFLIKSSVNFAAVAVIGVLMALGMGPHRSPWLTVVPAAASVLVIVLLVLVAHLGPGDEPAGDSGRLTRWWSAARRSLVGGTGEAVAIVRSGDVQVIGGSIGYWAFDNAVLIATFAAFGVTLPLTVVLMGYLIGQLGGLLPLPGGIGGIDGGLIGVLVLYGAPAAATVAAVLAYRLILFWVPLVIGAPAFVSLWRRVDAH
jgi:uncharacterized membrane protein YbhN (UPF0104 family)